MSRAGLYGSLVAAVAALFVVSCGPKVDSERTVNTEGVVHIVFTCRGAVGTIGLTGDNGQSAWKVDRPVGERIGWVVKDWVTINSIKLKTGDPLPVNVTHSPSQAGDSLIGTVNGRPGTTYPYSIDVTCRQNGDSARLIIDPEMIVR